jgi:nicotinate phosphoribosyltransferase
MPASGIDPAQYCQLSVIDRNESLTSCRAAQGDDVLEFGLRRAQGMDGAMAASRAAYVGGCSATSNVLAGRQFGIPVRGTHAHSWVMSFESERDAFRAYAESMPNNCLFLVDTYDTLEGVRHAIEIGEDLKKRGHGWREFVWIPEIWRH